MIDAIRQREEEEERRHEQGRRLPLYAPPPPEIPEEEEELPPRSGAIIDYELTKEGATVKITKRQLKRIIKEEKARLLKEYRPGAGSATGDDRGDRVLRQALELFVDAIVDEEMGEVVVDTGLTDEEVEAVYHEWIAVWPDAEMAEGGLIYTGVMVDL